MSTTEQRVALDFKIRTACNDAYLDGVEIEATVFLLTRLLAEMVEDKDYVVGHFNAAYELKVKRAAGSS